MGRIYPREIKCGSEENVKPEPIVVEDGLQRERERETSDVSAKPDAEARNLRTNI